jgi:dephospho-CoA kinase
MQIIFLIGLSGCGKGTVASALQGKKFAFGDIIREECLRKYGKTSPENMEKTVRWFHTGREHLLASRMWLKVKNSKRVIIDGCRNKRQFLHFCKLAHQRPTVVYVYSPRTYRWKLLKNRGRTDTSDRKFLAWKDNRELKQGLAYMIKHSDCRISNRGTLAQLKKKSIQLSKRLTE